MSTERIYRKDTCIVSSADGQPDAQPTNQRIKHHKTAEPYHSNPTKSARHFYPPNQEIALQFGITVIAVKKHMSAILSKIGATTRAEAIAIALRKHLLKI